MVLFPDSNVFIHFKPIEVWDRISISDGDFTIGLSLSVISELDKIKYSGNTNEIKRRVQAIVKKFQESSDLVFNGIKFEIPSSSLPVDIFQRYGLNPIDKDDHFIASVLCYKLNNENAIIKVITHDLGVKLKCKAHDLDVLIPADRYLILDDDIYAKEIKKLTFELNKLKNLQPKLHLEFKNNQQYCSFEIIKPWTEGDENEIEEKMSILKNKYPYMQPDSESSPSIFKGFNLFPRTKEKTEKYNIALDEFYSKCEAYFKDQSFYDYTRSLTLEIEIKLTNSGSTPANDVDVYMHFPDGFLLLEKEYKNEKQMPWPPDPAMFQLAPPDFSKIGTGIYHPQLPEINFSSFSIRKTNSYDVNDSIKILKHHFSYLFDKMFVVFENFEGVSGFTIDYEITASNLIEKQTGALNVIVVKIENE